MADYLSFGEVMLRLKSPGHERLFQSPLLEATFGGGEANVAVSLANFGLDAGFISALPDNDVGDAAIRELRGFGVDTSAIARSGARIGIYYLETGANQRPSQVIYDRDRSSICDAKPGDFDWSSIFSTAKWFHITGITPALSQSAADVSLEAVQAARAAGVKVSCDFNYRGKLWNYGKSAPDNYLMTDAYFTWWDCGRSYLCRFVDVLHMGFVDEVLFGREVIEEMPRIVAEWVDLERNRQNDQPELE